MGEEFIMSERVELRKCERPDCTAYHSPNFQHSDEVHIANLEWRVVEAAVKMRGVFDRAYSITLTDKNFAEMTLPCQRAFEDAVDALIAAREAELKEEK